jgi:hypothetical protein
MQLRIILIILLALKFSVSYANVNSRIISEDQMAPDYNFQADTSIKDDDILTDQKEKDISKSKQNKNIEYILNKKSSLFYTKEQLNQLDLVKEAVASGVAIDTNFNQEENIQEQQVVKRNAINFYLNSIIYYTANNWSIWINGNKINRESNNTDLELLTISEKEVKFKWTTGYDKFVETLSRIIDDGEIPKDIYVEITDNIAIVIFSLKPNQSFRLGTSLNIIEGR